MNTIRLWVTSMLYEGNISVKAALLSPYREVEKIIIDKNKKDRDTNYIARIAKENAITVEYSERESINELASGSTHGGVIAYVSDRDYQSISDITSDKPFIALVEGIEDPFNFGYILRSLYAAGCDAVITNDRNWSNAANVVAKASAGASEYLAHIVSEDFTETLETIKEKNIQIVCAMRDDRAIEMYDYNFNQAICICIGGEKRGLSKEVLKFSNQNVFIPYNLDFKNALNATSATTILAYEILRQRRQS